MIRNRVMAVPLALSVLLITTSPPTLAEPELPDPGELLIVNDLTLQADGTCSGNLTIAYGMLPTQIVRSWSAQVDGSCAAAIKEAVSATEPPQTWAPVGYVYVTPGADVRYYSSQQGQWFTDGVATETKWDYGIGLECPPSFQGYTNRYTTQHLGWHTDPINWEPFETYCDAGFFIEHSHARAEVGFLVEVDADYAECHFIESHDPSAQVKTRCPISNVPEIGPLSAEQTIATVQRGLSEIVFRGSGL